MKIVADENIAELGALFGSFGSIETLPGRSIAADSVRNAGMLLVRSVTPVNADLLDGSDCSFVGTCTIGTDHIDQHYLSENNIAFSSAPGCNAEAVVDYVLAALTRLALDCDFSLKNKCLGIVGVGNVGSRLKERLGTFGMRCICCDPPLAREGVNGLVSLDELIAEADIVTLHTPLNKEGEDSTYHLLNRQNLTSLRPGAVLINSARGPVIDNKALKSVLLERADIKVVLDVWEGEPSIDPELLNMVYLATPHIAGYSLEGKIRGTYMLYQAACRYFGIESSEELDAYLPATEKVKPKLKDKTDGWEQWIYQCVQSCYNITRDSAALKALASRAEDEIANGFDRLRKEYPLRREFKYSKLEGIRNEPQIVQSLKALGICYSFSSGSSRSSQAF